ITKGLRAIFLAPQSSKKELLHYRGRRRFFISCYMAGVGDLFSYFGFFFSALVYIAPMPTLYRVYHCRTSIERCSPIAYTLALYSSSLWLYYGCLESLKAVIAINAMGCVIESIYMSLYIYRAPHNARRRVFQERDVGDLSFALALSLTMSGICWFVYGLLENDFLIAIPNCVGAVLGVAQMTIYLYLCRPDDIFMTSVMNLIKRNGPIMM
ncbi:bidirectional sugar transporter SWEET13, partial [Striga asiatica]